MLGPKVARSVIVDKKSGGGLLGLWLAATSCSIFIRAAFNTCNMLKIYVLIETNFTDDNRFDCLLRYRIRVV